MPANTETTDDNTVAVVENTEALVDSNEALRIAAGLRADAVTAELDMKDALAAVSKASDDNGESLSKNTEAGRDNLRAIQNAMRGIEDYGDALVDNGTDSRKATRQMRTQEDVLIKQVARAFGITEGKARTYVGRWARSRPRRKRRSPSPTTAQPRTPNARSTTPPKTRPPASRSPPTCAASTAP